ncbi:MAG: hypothetical protein KGJ77_11750 [Acidobacteriota bacterium]|nr:hypothetical protein [Acidobacteriota bacterium]
MTGSASSHHVVVLAPMPLEMEAVTRAFGLGPARTEEDAFWSGRIGATAVTALHTGMGPPVTRASATSLFDPDFPFPRPDHVMSVGICGGLHPDLEVGTLLNPEFVVDHATGRRYAHRPPGTTPLAGSLVTMQAVTLDEELSGRLLSRGALGVDMESAAVAEVCEAFGCAWSVYRCIGDRYFDGLLDARLVAMANPDGSPDVAAVTRLLADEPDLGPKLRRLAHDSAMAAERAAEAAVRGCRALGDRRQEPNGAAHERRT